MARLMSCAYTEQQVIDRTKRVTRRLGWMTTRPGHELVLCRKVMGRRKGEPLVRLARVRVLEAYRESLQVLIERPAWGAAEMILEGFPGMDPAVFIQTYFVTAQGVAPDTEVTRIRWEYLPHERG
jgi:hypothetical protein